MSFSIMCTRRGSFQLQLSGELDASSLLLLRRELATVLSSNPNEFEVRVPDGALIGGAGAHLLESFLGIVWARGCQSTFARGQAPAVEIGDRPQLRRLLTGRDEPPATA